ncbi:SDR family NAD(P)-dependent oxidoreductase [Phenylobacterium sp.]|uniref:SDR family NAD(P)-dependent oxidoreductase n=1 Tax=Phenylobacterium sp. TaxID=1871053 RepID=UPI002FC660D2
MARVLITGGAGFIGSRLVQTLVSAGDEVVVYDSLLDQVHGPAPTLAPALADCRFIQGDIRDRSRLEDTIRQFDPDTVFHLASETGTGQSHELPMRYCEVNVNGTALLVEGLRALSTRPRRVVLAGSRAVYGEGAYRSTTGALVTPDPRRAEDMARGQFAPLDAAGLPLTPMATDERLPPTPVSIYASTKLMQEYVLRQGLVDSPTTVCVLRLQNVYGPGQSLRNPYTGVLSIFARQVLDGRTLQIYEDGDIARDFVFVDDVVRALVRAGVAEVAGDLPINIGSGKTAFMPRVASILLQALGRPADDYVITGQFRAGDIRHAVADIRLADDVLGWRPEVSLDDGMRALADWARREREAGRI